MPEDDGAPMGPRLVPTLVATLLWGAAATLVALGSRSPIPLPFILEPTPTLAVTGFLLTRALWRIVHRQRPGPTGEVAGRALRGAGWGLLVHTGLVLAGGELAELALAGGLGTFALILYRQHRRFPEDEPGAGWAPALVALAGLALATVAALLAILRSGTPGPLQGRLGILAIVGLATLALTHVARTLVQSPRPQVARVAHVLAARPRRVLGLVLGVTGYLLHRPLVDDQVAYLHVLEWGLGLALLGYSLERLGAWYRRDARDHPWEAPWRVHEQEVADLRDPTAEQVETLTTQFLAGDLPPEEYAKLWRHLARDLAEPHLAQRADEVANLDETPEPRFLRFPWRVHRIREANRTRRRRAHERILTTLEPDTP